MSMMRFGLFFPELALHETRTVRVLEARAEDDPLFLPVDEYGFDEVYCVDPKCDCRRVIVNVLAQNAQAHLATISHAFEPPPRDHHTPEQTFLDPINRQSRWSKALLHLFQNHVLRDPVYCQRLIRHYELVKAAVSDPGHPCQGILRKVGAGMGASFSKSRQAPIIPPPPRRGKRKWR